LIDSIKRKFTPANLSPIPGAREMPRACPRGVSRWPLYRTTSHHLGCHGLVPWRFRLVAIRTTSHHLGCHGLAPWRVHAGRYTNYKSPSWMPRACPVEVHA